MLGCLHWFSFTVRVQELVVDYESNVTSKLRGGMYLLSNLAAPVIGLQNTAMVLRNSSTISLTITLYEKCYSWIFLLLSTKFQENGTTNTFTLVIKSIPHYFPSGTILPCNGKFKRVTPCWVLWKLCGTRRNHLIWDKAWRKSWIFVFMIWWLRRNRHLKPLWVTCRLKVSPVGEPSWKFHCMRTWTCWWVESHIRWKIWIVPPWRWRCFHYFLTSNWSS